MTQGPARSETTVDLRCTGHVRRAVGFGSTEFTFEGDRLRDFLEDFFAAYGITIDDPLGQFRPADGITDAPSTPEKLDDPEHPHAVGGFADDAYVETEDGELIVGGQDEPEDVDPSEAPGVSDDAETTAD